MLYRLASIKKSSRRQRRSSHTPPQLNPHRSHLRLGTITRVRWFAVLGQLGTVAFVFWGLGIHFPVGWCLFLIGLSAWLNIVLRLLSPASHLIVAQYAALILGFDIWHLTALLYLTGGLLNPFAFLLLVPVTISASTQAPRITMQLGLLAIGCATVLAYYHHPLPWYPEENPMNSPVYMFGLWTSVVVGVLFMAFYSWRVAKEAQKMANALTAAELVLAREQKLSALDGLAAAAAHELGTPLSTIILVAKELRAQCTGREETAADLELMSSQAQRCQNILATLSRKREDGDLVHNRMSITEMIDEIVEPYRNLGKGVTVITAPNDRAKTDREREEPIIRRNPGLLYGIGNLIENAVDFASSQVIVKTDWDGRKVRITIEDNGPGFAMEILDILGEPYVSSRHPPGSDNPGEDSGLGLGFFIAKTLLERSGAELFLENRKSPETGARITLSWPRNRIVIDASEWFA